jgi:uncharacterized protein (DUF1330 family)
MAAYIIGRVELRETAWREAYAEKAKALVQKHSERMLTGASQSLVPRPGDPEYAPLITLRWSGAHRDIILVDEL